MKDEMMKKSIDLLPYELTVDQKIALKNIKKDLQKERIMSHLVQGEVGSGKTLIAFLISVLVIENGFQVVFMSPTELLAKQHYRNAKVFFEENLGIKLCLLTGKSTKKEREIIAKGIKNNEIKIVIATHTVIYQELEFYKLSLLIIDEQQRFGVEQRKALFSHKDKPDLLYLTATPIPRTLAHAIFFKDSVSSIKTMPKNRAKIYTHFVWQDHAMKVYNFVKEELDRGRQAYFVYPLIEEGKNSKLKNAKEMAARLSLGIFKNYRVELIHSKIKESEKDLIMKNFADGKIDVLVSTSVVEVGIDNPNATCMVIEFPERFGLSTLHQIRGRVGRGEHESYCFLISLRGINQTSVDRLKVLLNSNDGFEIAEKDMLLRGFGDLLGRDQSGFKGLKINALDNFNFKEALEDVKNIANGKIKLSKEEEKILEDYLKTYEIANVI